MLCVRSCSDSRCACVLQAEDATVTVVHSKTKDAQALCAEADILIAAIGKAEMVKADWVKPGAAVIDVGTNPVPVSPPWLPLRMSRALCMGAGVCLAGHLFNGALPLGGDDGAGTAIRCSNADSKCS